MQLISNAFKDGQQIPIQYTKDGDNVSPPLRWSDVPERAQELVLLLENITPQTQEPFVHWLLYGISPELDGLPKGFKHKAEPEEPVALCQGKNAIGNVGYDGPLGTVGRTIRYRFTLCALDRPLDLPPGVDKETVAKKMPGHVLDEAQLIVVHERKG
jgi:Raf kinase inhibitor-like YbhB/YbcL family protein